MEKMKVIVLSSLAKVFSGEEPQQKPIAGQTALKNQRSAFQVAFSSSEEKSVSVLAHGDLKDFITLYQVEEIPSCSGAYPDQDDYTIKREAAYYPDLLQPLTGEWEIAAGKWQSLWVEIYAENGIKSGKHEIVIEFLQSGASLCKTSFTLEVIDARLEKEELIYTNWFHSDCLCNYYKIKPFSPEYWQACENYLREAARHGMNAVLTPLFTPPLDTKVGGERLTVQLVGVKKIGNDYEFDFDRLTQWIEMCGRAGIFYLEMAHLFTQWGAKHAPKIVADAGGKEKKIFGWKTRASGKKYAKFLDAFAAALKEYIRRNGIEERCIFHVSDEPAKRHIKHYRKAAEIVRRNFGEFPVVDALSDFEFYQNGLIELPIPSNDHIKPFIGNVPALWTYYCCAQHKNYVSNRFFNMPSQRNRVLGFQLYKYDVKGFLHWGFNYWYTRFSARAIDPYQITDAGGAFAAGDSFVVYPAEDLAPHCSLRLKVFFDALQDLRALRLLERLISREETLRLLEEEGEITFENYPRSDEWQLKTRERIDRAIAAAFKNSK